MPPSVRARLHVDAFFALEQAYGGRAPAGPKMSAVERPTLIPHETDVIANELITHVRAAISQDEINTELTSLLVHYLKRAAIISIKKFRPETALRYWEDYNNRIEGPERIETINNSGTIALRVGNTKRAGELFNQAIELAQKHGNQKLEGNALTNLGILYRHKGMINEAEEALNSALEIHQENGNRISEANTLGALAMLQMSTARMNEAETNFERSSDIYNEFDNPRLLATALGNLAGILQLKSKLTEAYEMYSRALNIHIETGANDYVGVILGNMATIKHLQGNVAEADAMFEEAIDLHRKTGRREHLSTTLSNMGTLAMAADPPDYEKAERYLNEAVKLGKESGHRSGEALALGNLAQLYRKTDQFDLALRTYGDSLKIHRQVKDRRFEGFVLCNRAVAHQITGDQAAAEKDWMLGTEILTQINETASLKRKIEEMKKDCEDACVQPIGQH